LSFSAESFVINRCVNTVVAAGKNRLTNRPVPNQTAIVSSHKSARIAASVAALRGGALDARYLGYFDCFNRQLFYEAHEVLEDLWLADRHGVDGNFFKGLIQLAGAFVHLQKNRLRPAAALFNLAAANLGQYPARHAQLDVTGVQQFIAGWLAQLQQHKFSVNPLTAATFPRLQPDV
jgi:predicted metal-dependent hydrolase